MSHLTSTTARVEIATSYIDERGRTVHLTQHWNGTYVDARRTVARYVADNGLYRTAYGDGGCLLRDGVVVGHYSIILT